MKWRRIAENVVIGLITSVHVLWCRVRFKRGAFAPEDQATASSPILVVRCEAKIGDNLLHIPFLRALRSMYPGRPIHLLHHTATRSIYQHCPYIDERIEIAWPMSAPATLVRRLSLSAKVFGAGARRVRYGLALIPRWDEDLYAPFLAWISGAPRIVGFSRRVLAEKAWRNAGTDLLLTDAIDDRSVQHEARRPLQLLDRLARAQPALSSELEFWFSKEDVDKVSALLGSAASEFRWIAVAPGAALDRRKWPRKRFAEISQALAQQHGLRLMFLGTAAESADCETLAQACLPAASLNLAGQLDLAQTAAALSTCRLFIGNDSGLLHLACAVRTPVLEISCHPMKAPDLHANSPARFGPTVDGSLVLRPASALAPECRDGCSYDTAHCITTVATNVVLQRAVSVLGLATEGQQAPIETSVEPLKQGVAA